MAASYSEDLVYPRATVKFSLDTILLDLEGGRYVGPLLTGALAEIFSGRRRNGRSRIRGGLEAEAAAVVAEEAEERADVRVRE